MTNHTQEALVERLTRAIIGIENRTAEEAFDIMADRIRSALTIPPIDDITGSVPDGWRLVPIKPTEAMLDAFVARALQVSVHGEGGWTAYARNQWARMLSAAPVDGPDQ